MAQRVVILGAGTGGTSVANRLRKSHRADELEITVVDQDDQHVYQPGLLFVPFGLMTPEQIVKPRGAQLREGIRYLPSAIERVDIETNTVVLADTRELTYDVLVVATGTVLTTDETEGLTGPGWGTKVGTFYTLETAKALGPMLDGFQGGKLVVNIVDMPIKCPVAPLEFAFLADWYFHQRGIRDKVDITYVTPLDGAFTKPVASKRLGGLLASKGVTVVTEFNTGEVDGDEGKLVSWDGREVPFDLAVVIPLHAGAEYIERSEGLGDDLRFVPTDPKTLQSTVKPNIFAIGDATNLPTSKAGSVAHFEGDVLVENIERFLKGVPVEPGFDGHANCFIETGFKKAMLIDFNFDTEPLPGRFPSKIGLPLLQESRINHLGKLAFGWFYWHALLPGRDIPGIGSTMPTSGKELSAAAK